MNEFNSGDVQVGDVLVTDSGQGFHVYRIVLEVGTKDYWFIKCSRLTIMDGSLRSMDMIEYFSKESVPVGWSTRRLALGELLSSSEPTVYGTPVTVLEDGEL
jgi:hypothetical protein